MHDDGAALALWEAWAGISPPCSTSSEFSRQRENSPKLGEITRPQQVHDFLRDHPASTHAEVVAALCIRSAFKLLFELSRQHVVERAPGSGIARYRLTATATRP